MANTKLLIKAIHQHHFVDFDDIIYLKAEGNYTFLILRNQKKIVITKKLKTVETVLSPKLFFRVHHSYTVNINYLLHYHNKGNDLLEMTNGDFLPVSRTYKKAFFERFCKL